MRPFGLIAALIVFGAGFSAIPAHAAIQIDLTINFTPGEPIFPSAIPGEPIAPQQVTGVPFFTIPIMGGLSDVSNFFVGGFDSIGTLTAANPIFTGHFIPSDPIIPGNPIFQFSFLGSTDGFPTFAFAHDDPAEINGPPIVPPFISIGIFDESGPPIRQSGDIVAFDAPVVVGNWNITINTVADVPEPSTWAMMILGFAGVGFLRIAASAAARLWPDFTWCGDDAGLHGMMRGFMDRIAPIGAPRQLCSGDGSTRFGYREISEKH
jgi:PEP-CTERM motif